jgi:hypothetical protein
MAGRKFKHEKDLGIEYWTMTVNEKTIDIVKYSKNLYQVQSDDFDIAGIAYENLELAKKFGMILSRGRYGK